MWRPLEVFPYDWWPIKAEGRLLERLSTMPVMLDYAETVFDSCPAFRFAGGRCG
jgi:hypothetical protein